MKDSYGKVILNATGEDFFAKRSSVGSSSIG